MRSPKALQFEPSILSRPVSIDLINKNQLFSLCLKKLFF